MSLDLRVKIETRKKTLQVLGNGLDVIEAPGALPAWVKNSRRGKHTGEAGGRVGGCEVNLNLHLVEDSMQEQSRSTCSSHTAIWGSGVAFGRMKTHAGKSPRQKF